MNQVTSASVVRIQRLPRRFLGICGITTAARDVIKRSGWILNAYVCLFVRAGSFVVTQDFPALLARWIEPALQAIPAPICATTPAAPKGTRSLLWQAMLLFPQESRCPPGMLSFSEYRDQLRGSAQGFCNLELQKHFYTRFCCRKSLFCVQVGFSQRP